MKIDYGQELSNIREQQQNAVDKLKESYEADLSNIKKTNKNKEIKQKRNSEDQKEQIISDNQNRIDVLSKRTKKLLENRRDSFKRKLKEQRVDFNNRREDISRDFKKNLSNVQRSYDKSLKEHKYSDKNLRTNIASNFQKLIELNRKNSNEQLEEISSKSKKSIRDIRKDFSDREDKQVIDNRAEKTGLIKNYGSEISSTKDFFNKKIEELRESKDGELLRQRERSDNTVDKIKIDSKIKLENQKNNFLKAATRLNRTSERLLKNQEKDNKDNITQLQREMDQDRYRLTRTLDEVRDKSLKGKGVEFQKRAISDGYETRLKGLQKQMADQRGQFEILKDDLEYDVAIRSRTKDLKTRQKLDAKDAEQNSLLSEITITQREKERNLVDQYQSKIQGLIKDDEERAILKDNEFKRTTSRQREAYGHTVNKINADNIEKINDLQEQFAKEKSEIVYNGRKLLKDRSAQLKEEYINQVEQLMAKYEKKLAVRNYEFERMVEVKDETISNLVNNTKKELKAQQQLHKESKDIGNSQTKSRLDDQRFQYESRISAMKHNQDEEMARIKRESNKKVSKLTNTYEEKLRNLTSSTQSEMKKKIIKHRDELRRIVNQNKIRMDQMISNYERRLKEQKRAYQMDRSSEAIRTRS